MTKRESTQPKRAKRAHPDAPKTRDGGRDAPPSGKRKLQHPVIAAADLGVALLLVGGIWGALPARWWPVDVGGTLLAALLAAAGIGLLGGQPWARPVAVVAGWIGLATGAGLVTTLALTAAHISGLYGPVGAGGAILLTVVALLILPYLVLLPAAQLLALRRAAPAHGSDR